MKVSCIMPTADRAAFVPQAVACFLAQDHDDRELVVVDNGREPVAHLLPADPRIRCERVPTTPRLGELRNHACELARGEVIVHWDDDDWYPVDRISRQLRRLAEGAELCATSRIYFIDSAGTEAWEHCSGGARPWLAGSSFAYWRWLWQRQPFQGIRIGEDACFAAKVAPGRIADLADPALVVATIHANNTSPKRPHGPAWQRVDAARVRALKAAGDVPSMAAPMASAAPHSRPSAPARQPARRICVGVYTRGNNAHLAGTLASLAGSTREPFETVLIDDSPPTPLGAAAAFNRLLRDNDADLYVFVESGSVLGPEALARMCAALDADPRHGLVGPTTNMAWSVQGEFRGRSATERNIAMLARDAAARYGNAWRSLAPLYCLGDFCFVATRAVVEAVGGADTGYGLGPCWEMDLAVRAARAGYGVVWARGAYVFRHPFSAERERDEAAWHAPNKALYQRRHCGQLLSGARDEIAEHCRGEDCPSFAPPDAVTLRPRASAAAPAPRPQTPLVSCIMPTQGRPEWVQQAIRYFQRQTLGPRELVIVDNSRAPAGTSLPCDPRIRYVHRPQRMTIGAMRNLACELARGEFIVHWDDDDWYGPERLAAQVAPLVAGTADISAFDATPFFDVARGTWWSCSPELYARLFVQAVHGGTLAYARRLFDARHRFPNVSIAEDAAFLRAAVVGGARLARIAAGEHFVYVRHGRNAWQFACGQAVDPRGWTRLAGAACMQADMPFYAERAQALRHSA